MKKIMWVLVIILLIAAGGYCMFNFLNNTTDTPITKEFKTAPFDQIKVDSSTDSVTFVESKHYRVSYTGQEKLLPVVEVKNGALIVDSPKKNVVINGGIFNFKKLKQTLTIEMPRKELKYLSIDTSNGGVTADHLYIQKGEIDTSNGSIHIKHLMMKKGFSIDSSNGSVKIGESNAQGFDLNTSVGHITVNGKDKGDSFEKNSSEKNMLEINTSNGDICVN